MTSTCWGDRRVFVTGHTGFKGSWLSLWLSLLGARVWGYALPPHSQSLYELAGVADTLHSTLGDIRDQVALRKALADAAPEVVFHLAAQPLVRDSYERPLETFATNVMGTAHVLEAVRAVPSVRAVIVVTTDKCYLNREWVWGYRETDPLGGHDPYSASKACAEIVTAAYRSSFFDTATREKGADAPVIATARAGNVIGGGDFSRDRLLPDFIRAVRDKTTLDIRHPQAIRPWQFVLEPLAGYIELAERALAGDTSVAQAWNFGPDEAGAKPVGEVVNAFAAACGGYQPANLQFGNIRSVLHETTLLKLDTGKARALLKWRPHLDFDQTIALTAQWYCGYLDGADMRTLTRRQLETYHGIVAELR